MVNRALLLLLISSSVCLAAKEPDYKIGDRAREDVITPIRLVVVDTDATDKLKEREAQRVPVIYRYYPRALEEADSAFRATFANTRTNFLESLDSTWRAQGAEHLQDRPVEDFHRFVSSFQKQNLLFPVDTNLAARWAAGTSDEEFVSGLSLKLRETMKSFIRSDVSPQDIWVGSTLRLVSLADNETMSARLADERGSNVSKTNFVSLPRAKTELQNTFSPEDRAIGKYLASFVKPNCEMETGLTRELRARRTEGLVTADRYEAGQAIVRKGQAIDQKALAALNLLREKTAPAQPAQPVAAPETAQQRWLIWALLGIFGMLLALFWLVAQRRPANSLLPVPLADAPPGPAGDPWQQRALAAEQRAQKVQAAARAGLLSQLSRWLSEKMTQKLISQRTQLLDAHQHAAVEIAELEARLEKVRAPLQERLRAYERRIAELEQDLLVKGEENRELIKAKIEIARKQLEIERGKQRAEFN
jgi:7TM-HD extracellular protein